MPDNKPWNGRTSNNLFNTQQDSTSRCNNVSENSWNGKRPATPFNNQKPQTPSCECAEHKSTSQGNNFTESNNINYLIQEINILRSKKTDIDIYIGEEEPSPEKYSIWFDIN